MTQATRSCPACHAELHASPGFVTWCESCDWGLDPSPHEDRRQGRVEKWWQARLNKVSHAEHDRLVQRGLEAGASDRRLVYLLATIVHLLTASVVLLLVLLLASGAPWPVKAFVGLILAGVAWEVGPWPRQRPPRGFELDADSAPALHRLVAEVATQLQVAPPAIVVVDEKINAGWSSVGFRRRRALLIGYPLWAVLDPQEKLALLGHELGHEASGDLRRGWYVGGAVDSLRAWRELLTPAVRDMEGGLMAYLVYVGQWVLLLAMAPVIAVLGALELGLGTLALRSGQQTEHVADRLGARVAGREAALGLTSRLAQVESLGFALDVALRYDDEVDVGGKARSYVASVPAHELRRQLRLAAVTQQRIDASHPPTTRRLELLRLAPETASQVVLDEARATAVDREIDAALPWVRRRMTEAARA